MENMHEKLIISYLHGKLTEVEIERLRLWIQESAENKKLFFEVKAIHDAVMDKSRPIDAEGSWQRLLRKKALATRSALWRQIGRYAAAGVLAAALTSVGFWLMPTQTESIATLYIGGDGLEADKVVLPDGTQVCLGAKTSFRYENDYGKSQRRVYLDGEAFFDVSAVKDKPFIVKTHNQEIEALGTRFNVTAYSSDSVFTTTLLDGSVRLATEHMTQKQTLSPGQQLEYNCNARSLKIANVDASRFTAWISGYYYFPSQRLEAILHRLGNVYGMRFTVTSEQLNNKTFTGTFYRGQSIKDIMEIINISIPIKYTIDEHHVTITE
jgi:ferric-dicitrate binding protein FerR (iron transport regulator)